MRVWNRMVRSCRRSFEEARIPARPRVALPTPTPPLPPTDRSLDRNPEFRCRLSIVCAAHALAFLDWNSHAAAAETCLYFYRVATRGDAAVAGVALPLVDRTRRDPRQQQRRRSRHDDDDGYKSSCFSWLPPSLVGGRPTRLLVTSVGDAAVNASFDLARAPWHARVTQVAFHDQHDFGATPRHAGRGPPSHQGIWRLVQEFPWLPRLHTLSLYRVRVEACLTIVQRHPHVVALTVAMDRSQSRHVRTAGRFAFVRALGVCTGLERLTLANLAIVDDTTEWPRLPALTTLDLVASFCVCSGFVRRHADTVRHLRVDSWCGARTCPAAHCELLARCARLESLVSFATSSGPVSRPLAALAGATVDPLLCAPPPPAPPSFTLPSSSVAATSMATLDSARLTAPSSAVSEAATAAHGDRGGNRGHGLQYLGLARSIGIPAARVLSLFPRLRRVACSYQALAAEPSVDDLAEWRRVESVASVDTLELVAPYAHRNGIVVDVAAATESSSLRDTYAYARFLAHVFPRVTRLVLRGYIAAHLELAHRLCAALPRLIAVDCDESDRVRETSDTTRYRVGASLDIGPPSWTAHAAGVVDAGVGDVSCWRLRKTRCDADAKSGDLPAQNWIVANLAGRDCATMSSTVASLLASL